MHQAHLIAIQKSMGIEIERRFLISAENAAEWRSFPSHAVLQGYIARDGLGSRVRVRVIDNKALLTIKGTRTHCSRPEYEFEIPLGEAEEMLSELHVGDLIEKRRYRVPFEGFIWDIDEFFGGNSGLLIAEIELPEEDTQFERPNWVGREVTHLDRYGNASLSIKPFTKWPEVDRLSSSEEAAC